MYLIDAIFVEGGSQICLECSADNNFKSLGSSSRFEIKNDVLIIHFEGKKILHCYILHLQRFRFPIKCSFVGATRCTSNLTYSTTIKFYCSLKNEDPFLENIVGCVYNLIWRTQSACPKISVVSLFKPLKK